MNPWKELCEGGGYTLPYLIHLYNEDGSVDLRLVNDNKSLEWKGITYSACTFNYNPSFDGSVSLEIELVESHLIINALEAESILHLDAIGVISGQQVVEISAHRNKFGKAKWDGKTLNLTLDKDDRMGMTFPALIFTSYNNRGNA